MADIQVAILLFEWKFDPFLCRHESFLLYLKTEDYQFMKKRWRLQVEFINPRRESHKDFYTYLGAWKLKRTLNHDKCYEDNIRSINVRRLYD